MGLTVLSMDPIVFLQGTRYIDIFCPKKRERATFVITPDKVYKNDKLYYDGPAMVVWPAGIFHRIITGEEGSISVNFASRTKNFDLSTNFNIYDLNVYSGEYRLLRDGSEDQPDLKYKYPNKDIETLFKEN